MKKIILGCLALVAMVSIMSCGDDGVTEPPYFPPGGDGTIPFSLPDGFEAEIYVDSLALPSSLTFAPDGRLFVNELQSGNIKMIDTAGNCTIWANVQTDVVGDFPAAGENGLIGLAFDPDFDNNHFVYASYAYRANGDNLGRVVRFEEVNGLGQNMTVLMDSIKNQNGHQITSLNFGPDGKLYVVPSDAFSANANEIRDMNSTLGKVIRMNKDGSMPSDNPFPGTYFYAKGIRNAFDFTFLNNGDLLMSENGPESDDEVNIIEAGEDYGWPDYTGEANVAPYKDPIYTWEATVSPTGLIQYKGTQFPSTYQGKVFQVLFGSTYSTDISDRTKRIVLMTLTGSGLSTNVTVEDFAIYNKEGIGNPLDIAEGPDGSLYITDIFRGEIYRIYFP